MQERNWAVEKHASFRVAVIQHPLSTGGKSIAITATNLATSLPSLCDGDPLSLGSISSAVSGIPDDNNQLPSPVNKVG